MMIINNQIILIWIMIMNINSNHAKDTNYNSNNNNHIYMYSGVFGWRYRPDKTNWSRAYPLPNFWYMINRDYIYIFQWTYTPENWYE